MARIPDEEIERLKREISLERLAEAKGVKLKKHGENLIGLCPFHDDREPSLVITSSKNLWHCLGACQAGGTVIELDDEGGGRVVSARGRALASRPSLFSGVS